MEHTLDANGKSLGRTATQAAVLLMGKDRPDFEKNKVSGNKVHITNTSKASINPKKLKSVEYVRYSGYPGGQKFETMEKVIEKKGYSEVFRKAVYGMLPANRLRALLMKNLIISE
ncbi:50S ribosomal protein L13 [Candidatus Wolfebacteria bacterium]|nr:MAG: 50S ribosomal protein L13 [Candidatus Wolfebacteria bacterium]